MSLSHKISLLLVIVLVCTDAAEATNRRTDKSGKHKSHNSNNNDWQPITYRTEVDHNVDANFEEADIKDISGKSSNFFQDITGTRSPNEKDLKQLSARGLKLVKEQELEDKYGNLKAIETDAEGAAPLNLKIPNNNFNKPYSYGFLMPENDEEQATEQARQYQNYHNPHNAAQQQQMQPHSPLNVNQDGYYQIPNQFAPHFEALTQARDEAAQTNYHNPNQNDGKWSDPDTNTQINHNNAMQHTFHGPPQHYTAPHVRHYEENANRFGPTDAPPSSIHVQKFPAPAPQSYSHQQLFGNESPENTPHFEALTGEKPQKKQQHNQYHHQQHHDTSDFDHSNSCDDDTDGHGCQTSSSTEHRHKPTRSHKNRKHHRQQLHHRHRNDPNKATDNTVFFNHKIYHNEEESSSPSSVENQSASQGSHSGSSRPANKHKKKTSKKSNKPKRHHHHNHHHNHHHHKHSSKQVHRPSSQDSNETNHPNKGHSYQVIEYPQESRITERIAIPDANRTASESKDAVQSNSPHRKTNKFSAKQVDKDSKAKTYSKTRLSALHDKTNASQGYPASKNATESNASILPSPEYKFLINYKDEYDPNEANHQKSNQRDHKASKSIGAATQTPRFDKEIRYFQDIYVNHPEPHYMEMGHKMEAPGYQEERFEEHDRKNAQVRGSVKWVKDNGEQGQQLWDLGH